MESYEVAYNRLLELSDGDIDDFLEDFVEKDRRFFILFGYAIRLKVRNEGLKQRIQEIQVCSRLFMSPLSRQCFWVGVGLSSPECPASLPTPEPDSSHKGGIRGMQRSSQN